MSAEHPSVTPPEELRKGAILVRPFRSGDVEPMLEAARESIAEVQPWLPWCHPDYARADAERWVLSRPDAWARWEELSFIIADADSGRFLGGCGLNQINWPYRTANLGYWVRTGGTRRGAATAAAILVASYGFRGVGLQRIEILAAVENRASQRVAEKVGARRKGVLRSRRLMYDSVLYLLVPEDLD
ncbi:MAG TPA: GNAT family protein [Candidatus Limnocylindria bacterium]|nr:GNAT family protein [Candidatus Limnocylindria bacterium]